MIAAHTRPVTPTMIPSVSPNKNVIMVSALLDIIFAIFYTFIAAHHVTPIFTIVLLIAVDTTLGFTVQAV